MNSLYTAPATLAQWPTAERVRALKRILPRAKVQAVQDAPQLILGE